MCLVRGQFISALGPGSGTGTAFVESEHAIHSFNKHMLTPSWHGPVFGPEMQRGLPRTSGKASIPDGAI